MTGGCRMMAVSGRSGKGVVSTRRETVGLIPRTSSSQLSSSDMSLQSGRRSQRYSRATHSL